MKFPSWFVVFIIALGVLILAACAPQTLCPNGQEQLGADGLMHSMMVPCDSLAGSTAIALVTRQATKTPEPTATPTVTPCAELGNGTRKGLEDGSLKHVETDINAKEGLNTTDQILHYDTFYAANDVMSEALGNFLDQNSQGMGILRSNDKKSFDWPEKECGPWSNYA